MNKSEINKKIYKINYIYNKIFKENFNKRLTFDWSSKPLRFDIINNAIKIKKYKNYLEIGCFENENFDKINIESKTGVDPVSGGTVRDTSDNFFLKNQIFYDIIFIDGLHIYNQVRKDIANSLKFLKPNGIIILHDCLPLKIRDQMVPRSHEHWNGDTWKALVRIWVLFERLVVADSVAIDASAPSTAALLAAAARLSSIHSKIRADTLSPLMEEKNGVSVGEMSVMISETSSALPT